MKKTNHHVVDDQEIMRFNLTREILKGREFNQSEMREELNKKLGYSKAAAMLRALCNGTNPPILKIKRGVYCINPKPVFKERLQLAWDEYTKMANPQCYKTGKHEHPISIDQAIKVLKDAGYKILKPITEYKEI
jgi:hypothetical protein